MPICSVAAPAKINLSLDVNGRRPDGYHLLTTVMQSIDLCDQVTVAHEPSGQGIAMTCDQPELPVDRFNTAWQAADFFRQAASLSGRIAISLKKQIPVAAGLAGGSADAAAVLFALDRMYPDAVSRTRLFEAAARIGADVPFCLQGGTVLCEGIGEKLTPLQALPGIPVLLCKPKFGLSTSWVFSHLDLNHLGRRPDHKRVLAALNEHDLSGLAQATANVLESVSLTAYPELQAIKDQLLSAGAALAMMTGSGPTIYALFSSQAAMEEACRNLSGCLLPEMTLVATLTAAYGPRLIA
jgi:4-diphosphocytidyl-2-C-methyl-D-erythritol kinase